MAVYKKRTFGKPQCKPHIHHEKGHEHQAQLYLSLFAHVYSCLMEEVQQISVL